MTDWKVGDAVHCPHAQADGRVTHVYESSLVVRVTWTSNGLYEVGREYSWMPRQLVPIVESELN